MIGDSRLALFSSWPNVSGCGVLLGVVRAPGAISDSGCGICVSLVERCGARSRRTDGWRRSCCMSELAIAGTVKPATAPLHPSANSPRHPIRDCMSTATALRRRRLFTLATRRSGLRKDSRVARPSARHQQDDRGGYGKQDENNCDHAPNGERGRIPTRWGALSWHRHPMGHWPLRWCLWRDRGVPPPVVLGRGRGIHLSTRRGRCLWHRLLVRGAWLWRLDWCTGVGRMVLERGSSVKF